MSKILDLPQWMLKEIAAIAERLAVDEMDVIKILLAEALDRRAK